VALADGDTATWDSATPPDLSTWTGTGNTVTIAAGADGQLVLPAGVTVDLVSSGVADLGSGSLSFSIPGDATVNWSADVTSSATATIAGFGTSTGTFHVSGGSITNTATYCACWAVNANSSIALLIDGGSVTSQTYAIYSVAGAPVITLAGGTITGAGGYPAILLQATGSANPTLAINSGALVATGTGPALAINSASVSISGSPTITGFFQVQGTTSAPGQLTTATSLTNNITLLSVGLVTNTAAVTLSGAITGSGSLTKTGAGTLTLSGANTYTGGTTASAGALSIGAAANLGTGALTLNGGTLAFSAGFPFSPNVTLGAGGGTIDSGGYNPTLSGTISGGGGLNKTGSGLTVLTGTNTYTGGTTVSAGGLYVSSGANLGTGPLTINGGMLLWYSNGTLTQDVEIGPSGGVIEPVGFDVAVTGAFSVGGPFTLVTAGTLTLSGPTSFWADTSIIGGTLALEADAVVDASTTFQVATAGSFTNTALLTVNGALDQDTGGTVTNTGLIVMGAGGALGGTSPLNALTLDANGGTGTLTVAEPGASFDFTKLATFGKEPVLAGQFLLGWDTVQAGSPPYLTSPHTFTTGDTIYAQWGPAVCEIGTTQYGTFEDAWAAAVDGDTIKLLADNLTVPAGIAQTDTRTIDLNGYTLNISNTGSDMHAIQLASGAWLTVTGPGTLNANSNGGSGLFAYSATFNLAGGAKVNATGTQGGVVAMSGSTIFVTNASGPSGIGVVADAGSQVTVEGTVTGTEFIRIGAGNELKTPSDFTATPGPYLKVGYALYVDSTGNAWVWVLLPVVTAVTPSGSGAPVSGHLVVTFNKPVDPAVAGTVQLGSLPALTGGVWSAGNTVLTVPYSGLAYSTTYRVNIAGFVDAGGLAMTADSNHSFTTVTAGTATYSVTVVNGIGGGQFAAGATVSIWANSAPTGYVFDQWVTADGVVFANAAAFRTTFRMPAKAVMVEATYRPWVTYNVTEGAHQMWRKGTPTGARLVSDGSFAKFVRLEVDGKTVDPSSYVKQPGSTIVTIAAAFLQTLSLGTHPVVFVFTDGIASTTITILGAGTGPPTGDSTDNTAATWTLFASLLGLGAGIARLKRRRPTALGE